MTFFDWLVFGLVVALFCICISISYTQGYKDGLKDAKSEIMKTLDEIIEKTKATSREDVLRRCTPNEIRAAIGLPPIEWKGAGNNERNQYE